MESIIRTYLIDDEPAIPAVLENLFATYLPQIQVVGKSNDWQQALVELSDLEVDLLFLDIRMPGGTGFDFLEKLGPEKDFEVVFVTGYQDYALQAIKVDAADYLLKPIDYKELMEAVSRVEKRLARQSAPQREGEKVETLHVHLADKVVLIPVAEIAWIRAENNYSRVVTSNGQKWLISKTLKVLEEELEPNGTFLRINREILIHTRFLKSYTKHPPFEIEMADGEVFPISRRRKVQILKQLEE
jgi:two-component system LytT family response regulator